MLVKKNQKTDIKKICKIANLKEKLPHFVVKMFKTIFIISGVMRSNPSARLEKLRWPVMIVELKKRTKIFKNFESNSKF